MSKPDLVSAAAELVDRIALGASVDIVAGMSAENGDLSTVSGLEIVDPSDVLETSAAVWEVVALTIVHPV